ncbi:MAG TPA: B12-binding domain-containing protein, partial [Candidatus Acidoferrales bacterium]|nr:B12-binding domain-containing protein [Candidatus Acidoferrales bacterium]
RSEDAAAMAASAGDAAASASTGGESSTAASIGAPATAPTADLVERFVDAAIELDQEGVAAALDEMFARGTFERVAHDLVMPALRSLGDAWATGRLSVAGEHAASHAVLRRLAAAFEAAASPTRGPLVVVGLTPGGRHELGSLAFATAARRAGLPVAYLGADVPLEDWRSATHAAAAAVIGVPTETDVAAASALARQLRRAHPGLVVALGGAAAPSLRGVVSLPQDLGQAADALATALSGETPAR